MANESNKIDLDLAVMEVQEKKIVKELKNTLETFKSIEANFETPIVKLFELSLSFHEKILKKTEDRTLTKKELDEEMIRFEEEARPIAKMISNK